MAWTTTSGARSRQVIVAKYSPRIYRAKRRAKQDLLAAFGVKNADPKIRNGIVSRFAAQKGFDLIAQVMDRLAREEMIVSPWRGR